MERTKNYQKSYKRSQTFNFATYKHSYTVAQPKVGLKLKYSKERKLTVSSSARDVFTRHIDCSCGI